MERCEQLVKDGANGDGTTWPPTYAEFIGYCKPPKSDPKPPEHRTIESVFQRLPEPKEEREKRRKLGMQKCKGLMDILSE